MKSNEENEKSVEGNSSYDESGSNSSSNSDSEDNSDNQYYTKYYEETSSEEEEEEQDVNKEKSEEWKGGNAKLHQEIRTKRVGARKREKINHHSLYTSSTSVISHYLQQLCRLIEVYVLRNSQEWRPERAHHHKHHQKKKKNTSGKCESENKSGSTSQSASETSHELHRYPNEFTTQAMESADWVNVIMQIVGLVVLGHGQLDHGTWLETCTQYLQQIVEKCSTTIEGKGYVPITSRGDDDTEYDCIPRRAMELCLLHLSCIITTTPCYNSSSPSSTLHSLLSSLSSLKVHNLWRHAESVVERYVSKINLDKGEVSKKNIEMGVVLPQIGKHVTYERMRHTNNVESNNKQITCCSCNEEALYYQPQRQYKRRFVIPFMYKDNEFVTHLMCSLPLLAFLPELLRIPSDVLTIDGKVSISKLCFIGELSLCFYDKVAEVYFVKLPEFSASIHLEENDVYNSSHSTKLPLLFLQEPGKLALEQIKSYTGINTIKNINVQTHSQKKDDNVKTKEQTYSATLPFLRNGSKLEQIALIAIRNALASITYPNAIRITMTLDLSDMLRTASDDDVYNSNTKYKIPHWVTTVDKINVENN